MGCGEVERHLEMAQPTKKIDKRFDNFKNQQDIVPFKTDWST